MSEFEPRIVEALHVALGVQVGRVEFGEWGGSDLAARLGDNDLLVLQLEGMGDKACLEVLALWAHLERTPGARAVLVRVWATEASAEPEGDARLDSFLSSKLCDEVPEQFCCFSLGIDDAGALSGDVDALRARLSEAPAAGDEATPEAPAI